MPATDYITLEISQPSFNCDFINRIRRITGLAMHENIMCRSQLFLSFVLMYEVNADRLLEYPHSNRCTPRQHLCDVDGKHYHCLFDNKGRLGEWCLDNLQMIESMKCPYYNIHGDKGHLDARPCREMYSDGCPQKEYDSNQSFRYSDCVQLEKGVVTTTQLQKQHTTSESPLLRKLTLQHGYHSTTFRTQDNVEASVEVQQSRGERDNTDQPLNWTLIVGSATGFLLIVASIVVVVIICRKRPQQMRTPTDEERAINRGSNSSGEFSGE